MKKKYYMFKMNSTIIQGFSFILLALVIGVIYLIYGNSFSDIMSKYFNLSIIIYVPWMLVHELLHSISYVVHGAKFKNITYGAHIEKGVLCCLCKQNITKKNILFSLLYPFIFIGVITLIIGLIIDSPILVMISLYNISGCSGDFIMAYHLAKIKDFEFSEYNDPMAFGLYSSKDLSKRKMFGLEYVATKDKLERDDLKKFDVSKTSWICLIIFIVIAVINIIAMNS